MGTARAPECKRQLCARTARNSRENRRKLPARGSEMTRQEKHGWLIVASLFVALLAIAGSGYNTTPVFLPALLKAFGWSRARVSLLPSVAALTWGILVFRVGWCLDRVEARFVMVTGAVAAGIGFILARRADSFAPMFIAYMMRGAGIAAGTVAPAAFVVANWFGGPARARDGCYARRNDHGRNADDAYGELRDRSLGMAYGLPGLRPRVPDRDSVGSHGRAQPPARRAENVGGRAAEMLEGVETAAALRTRSLWMIVLAQLLWAFATTDP